MSYLLPHLHSGFAVDQAILAVRCDGWSSVGWRVARWASQGRPARAHRFWSARLQEEDRVVVIRFGHDYDETCMQMDEVRCRQRRRVRRRWRCVPRGPACCSAFARLQLWPPLPTGAVLVRACGLLPSAGAACPDALSTLLPSHLHFGTASRSPSPAGRSWRAARSA